MKLEGKTLLLTGASGGIGLELAGELASAGANLLLVGRHRQGLEKLAEALPGGLGRHQVIIQDLLTEDSVKRVSERCAEVPGGIDGIVNNAGMSEFRLLRDWSLAHTGKLLRLNLQVPMELIARLLPLLVQKPEALIVNVGSALGAIGNPGFSAYCASKAGLARFSESLRRELADTRVKVLHFNPRATDTDLNSAATVAMNRKLGNRSDSPALVAQKIVALIGNDRFGERNLGFPERLFIKLNALFPSLVDGGYRKQLPVIEQYAAAELNAELPQTIETAQVQAEESV